MHVYLIYNFQVNRIILNGPEMDTKSNAVSAESFAAMNPFIA